MFNFVCEPCWLFVLYFIERYTYLHNQQIHQKETWLHGLIKKIHKVIDNNSQRTVTLLLIPGFSCLGVSLPYLWTDRSSRLLSSQVLYHHIVPRKKTFPASSNMTLAGNIIPCTNNYKHTWSSKWTWYPHIMKWDTLQSNKLIQKTQHTDQKAFDF